MENTFVFTGEAQSARLAAPDVLKVMAPDGRLLLRIGGDGTVDGAVEDMGDAAVVFVSEVRRLIELGALGRSVA